MSFLPPLPPTFDAALRDVHATDPRYRLAAAERLADPPAERVEEAQLALRTLLDDAVGPVRAQALHALARIGTVPSDALRKAIADAHEEARAVAVSLLPADQTRELRAALEDEAPVVRVAAVFATAGRDALLCAAVGVLEDPAPEVRTALARALIDVPAERAIPLLEELVRDPDVKVQRVAALALANHGDSSGADILIACLDDWAYVDEASRALGALGIQAAREALRAQAQRLLLPLTSKAAVGAALCALEDRAGFDALRSVLRAWRSDGRAYAVELCGQFGLIELLPEIVALARRPRGVAVETIRRTLERLSERDSRAAEALRDLFPKGAS